MPDFDVASLNIWTFLGIIGGILFFGRFYVQWIVSELRKASVIPISFWRLSIAGTVFHMFYFVYRMDWILAVGTIADGFIYVRNLYLPSAPSQAPTRGDISRQPVK